MGKLPQAVPTVQVDNEQVRITEWRDKSFVQTYRVTRGDDLILECEEVRIFAATRDRSLRDVLDTVRGTHATTRAQIAALADGDAAPAEADAFLTDVPGYADHYEQHQGWIRELVGGR